MPEHQLIDQLAVGGLARRRHGDGLDEALVGKCHIWSREGPQEVALYDFDKCVKILVERDGMALEEAEESMPHHRYLA